MPSEAKFTKHNKPSFVGTCSRQSQPHSVRLNMRSRHLRVIRQTEFHPLGGSPIYLIRPTEFRSVGLLQPILIEHRLIVPLISEVSHLPDDDANQNYYSTQLIRVLLLCRAHLRVCSVFGVAGREITSVLGRERRVRNAEVEGSNPFCSSLINHLQRESHPPDFPKWPIRGQFFPGENHNSVVLNSQPDLRAHAEVSGSIPICPVCPSHEGRGAVLLDEQRGIGPKIRSATAMPFLLCT